MIAAWWSPRSSVRARLLLALCLVCAATLAGAVPRVHALDAGTDLGCGDELVEQQLANGASWRMCVRIQPYQGLTLEKVEFRPATGGREYAGYKRILDSLTLAQLNVTYDNGSMRYNDVTDYGFGGDHLLTQTPETCTGRTREVTNVSTMSGVPTQRTIPGICLTTVSTGLAYESQEWSVDAGPRYATQGSGLEVSSLSKVGWYEYQQKITLDDEGGIDVGLGATGDVAPGDAPGVFFSTDPTKGWQLGPAPTADGQHYYATSHWHNAIYRVDFGIDSGQSQQVEQWDYASSDAQPVPTLSGTSTVHDKAFVADPGGDHARLSWWRVLNPDSLNADGHQRSYQIVNDNPLDVDQALTTWPLAFTNADACEQFASYNLDPGCPDQNVLDYVADDQAPLTDPVAWVNVDFHHVDRDEDQSPMHTHWQHFQLIPRDFFAQGPATPEARSCINGPGFIDFYALPCIATNQTPPRVTASASPVGPGTTLTATPGTWNEARTTWDYAYLWFRDGVPITGTGSGGSPTAATEPTYVVTAADAGHAITVKVTASHPGYVSATAESAAVRIPGGASTPKPSATAGPSRPGQQQSSAGSATSARTSVIAVAPVTRTRAGHRAKLVVRISTSDGAVATGRVVVKVRGHRVRALLVNGRAVLRLPKLHRPGRYRMKIRYAGSAWAAPARGIAVLKVKPR